MPIWARRGESLTCRSVYEQQEDEIEGSATIHHQVPVYAGLRLLREADEHLLGAGAYGPSLDGTDWLPRPRCRWHGGQRSSNIGCGARGFASAEDFICLMVRRTLE